MLSGLVLFYTIIYHPLIYRKLKKTDKISQARGEKSKEIKQVKKIIKKDIIKLPNHNLKNNQIIQQTLMLFNLIPYDGVLKELSNRKKQFNLCM